MAESKWSGSGGAGGGGDVFGPPSSTDNSVPRFDGTTGDTLQDSGVVIDDSDNVSGVNNLDAATITLPGGDVQTQIDSRVSGPVVASSTDNAVVRWDSTTGRLVQNSAVTVSDTGVVVGATIDGDDNTIQDLALSSLKAVLGDATKVLQRDATGAVVSGPATLTDAGDLNGLKTIDVRNDDNLSGDSAYMLRLNNRNNTPESHPFINFQRARAANADVQNGDEVGGLDFRPRFNGNTQTTAKIQVEYTGDGTTRLSDIVFQTSNAGAPAERMRIAADGKVTIAGDFEVQGATTTINTTNLEVEDKNITVNFNGTDASAAGAGLTVEGTGASTLATIQYDAALTSKWKLGASGSEDEAVTRTAPQALTNKTINGSSNTITNVSLSTGVTGTLPIPNGGTGQTSKTAAFDALSPQTNKGDLIAFDGTDAIRLGVGVNGQVLAADSTAASGLAWTDAPSAGGFVNYITNGSAESSTTGWATYADAAAATPVDGTGGSPNVTWTRNTSSPLRGNADFAFTKDAADRQGQGVAFPFTIATTDRSKKCQISFDYDTVKTNYAAGDLRVYVYDVTNATLITPQTVDIPRATSTFTTTFDSTTSTSYRLILHVATVSALAYTVNFDNFVVNAGQVVQGAAVASPQSVTITHNWGANATATAFETREGSWANYYVRVALSGAPAAAGLILTLPSGRTIDTSVLLSTASGGNRIPGAAVGIQDVAPGVPYEGTCYLNSSTQVGISALVASGTYTDTSAAVTNVIPFTFASGDFLTISFRVPIAEWAGNGTVNLGPGAQVEYAYNTSTSTSSTDTTSFGYGTQGAQIQNITTDLQRRVRFQYPIQADDVISVEVSQDRLKWYPLLPFTNSSASYTIIPWQSQNGVTYGFGRIIQVNTTDIDVVFGAYANATGATFGSAGQAWSSGGGGAYWRARKGKASAPVGFSRASPANGFGLVAPRRGQQSLTVTGTNWTTVRAVGIYYQDQDGNHRLKFNIAGSLSSATRTGVTLTVTGVTFKNVAAYYQPCAFMQDSAASPIQCYANPNTSSIVTSHSSATTTYTCVSGDVELESAPTWA